METTEDSLARLVERQTALILRQKGDIDALVEAARKAMAYLDAHTQRGSYAYQALSDAAYRSAGRP